MASLAEAIASLTNPIPKIRDPEDDVNIETVAKVGEFNEEEDEVSYTISELRRKTAPLLEDIDPAYTGKKVSRKSFGDIYCDGRNAKAENDSQDLADLVSNGSENSDYDEDASDEELSDADLEKFKSCVKNRISSDAEESVDDEDLDEAVNESEVSNEAESADDIINKFSNIDVTSEIEKGQAVKAQKEIWNRLCECRIRLQRLLIIANKLPQFSCWKILKQKGGKEINESISKGSNSVKLLLNNCLNLQTELLIQNPETNVDFEANQKSSNADNEEIASDTDEEMIESEKPETTPRVEKKFLKRKLQCDEYSDELAKRHKSLIPYRDSVIQKWDEKTRLTSGRITQKSFSAFDSSVLKQIEQILQDENRLLKRTQLKRSIYRVLGKPDVTETKTEENPENTEKESKQDMLLKDYDSEIFDDDDFYRQLLKDVIESKSVGIDRAILKKQMEIQNVRRKMKKNVDTKASKGRKIRYDVHPKLVNFMAPSETSLISDDARDNLLKCIFGKSSVAS